MLLDRKIAERGQYIKRFGGWLVPWGAEACGAGPVDEGKCIFERVTVWGEFGNASHHGPADCNIAAFNGAVADVVAHVDTPDGWII
jgi:hypothetical protein